MRLLAAPLLSYLGAYVSGLLPYSYPPGPFTPGTNGIGLIEAVGEGVFALAPGRLVAISPHLVASENVAEPPQVLMGLTAVSPDSGAMLAVWPDGTLADYALAPVSVVTPLDGLEDVAPERLATLGKFVVPLGGLLRGRLAAGETLVVHGATGYFGSAAVLLGVALGAERVVAVGRDRVTLQTLAETGGRRVASVATTGDVAEDSVAIRAAAHGGAHLGLDIVGRAQSADGTLAVLRGLRRGGRLVLMGSMEPPLTLAYGEVMRNDWELIGNFMYRRDAFAVLAALVRAHVLNLDAIRLRTFALADVPTAIGAAAAMRGLDCTIVRM